MTQSTIAMNTGQIEAETGKRLESIRLMQNISQQDLASKAGVSRRTISRMENGQGVSFNTLIRVMRALDLTNQLENLVPSLNIRPIERVKQKQPRKHASSPRKKDPSTPSAKTPWKWGDR